MRTWLEAACGRRPTAHAGALRRWRRDESGVAAIEFAIVAMPFLLFCLGVMGTGHLFFSTNNLEHAVETTARLIRTGQAQQGNPSAVPPVPPMTVGGFKQAVCDHAASFIDCNNVRVHVQSGDSWEDIDPVACLAGGALANSAGANADPLESQSGGASQVVLVTVCYEWDLGAKMPYLLLSNMANGSTLVQVATTFRTEPY